MSGRSCLLLGVSAIPRQRQLPFPFGKNRRVCRQRAIPRRFPDTRRGAATGDCGDVSRKSPAILRICAAFTPPAFHPEHRSSIDEMRVSAYECAARRAFLRHRARVSPRRMIRVRPRKYTVCKPHAPAWHTRCPSSPRRPRLRFSVIANRTRCSRALWARGEECHESVHLSARLRQQRRGAGPA